MMKVDEEQCRAPSFFKRINKGVSAAPSAFTVAARIRRNVDKRRMGIMVGGHKKDGTH